MCKDLQFDQSDAKSRDISRYRLETQDIVREELRFDFSMAQVLEPAEAPAVPTYGINWKKWNKAFANL